MEEEATVLEQTIFTTKEVFVYKVPPLRSATGHRAEDWGLANPLFTGALKIFQADTKCRVVIYSYKNPETLAMNKENLIEFGQCPIEVKPKEDIKQFIDAVVDSSRYYVVRLKDPKSSNTVMIGIGFRERDAAFDFKSSLNEYVRYVDRMDLAEKMKQEQLGAAKAVGTEGDLLDLAALPVVQMQDMSIKEGEKIKVNVPKERRRPKASTSGASGGFKLAPPPANGNANKLAPPVSSGLSGSVFGKVEASASGPSSGIDEFLDFASAPGPTASASAQSTSADDLSWMSETTKPVTNTSNATAANAADDDFWGAFS
jgi:hypothetical protein